MSNPSWLPTWPATWPDITDIYQAFTIPRQYPRGLYNDVTSDEYLEIQGTADVASWIAKTTEWIKRDLWPQHDSEALFLGLWETAMGVAEYATTAARQAAIIAYARILQRTATSDLVKAIFTQVFSTDDPANVSYSSPTAANIEAGVSCQWAEQSVTTGPGTGVYRYAMAYDSLRHRAIIFGGVPLNNNIYAYDFGTTEWSQLTSSANPSGRWGSAMAYDPDRDVVVLFGGFVAAADQETWELDCTTDEWTQIAPVASPAARYSPAMAYDETRQEMILFGGSAGGNETWSYDPATPTWTNEAPATTPAARLGHRLVWDADNALIVMVGGRDVGTVCLNDTYKWNGTNWTSVATDPDYDIVYRHAAWYDTHRKRVVVFGGANYDNAKNIVRYYIWELPYGTTTWERKVSDDIIPRYEIQGCYSTKYRCGMITMGYLDNYDKATTQHYYEGTDHYVHNSDTYARCHNYLHIHHTAETQDEDSALADSLIKRTVPAWADWTCGRYDEGEYGSSATGAEYGTWNTCTYDSD